MPNRSVPLALFLLMPQEEQIAHVMLRGIPMPDRSDPLILYYQLDDFYVRIRIEMGPLRILDVDAQRVPFRW